MTNIHPHDIQAIGMIGRGLELVEQELQASMHRVETSDYDEDEKEIVRGDIQRQLDKLASIQRRLRQQREAALAARRAS